MTLLLPEIIDGTQTNSGTYNDRDEPGLGESEPVEHVYVSAKKSSLSVMEKVRMSYAFIGWGQLEFSNSVVCALSTQPLLGMRLVH